MNSSSSPTLADLSSMMSLNHHLEDEYWSLFQSLSPLVPETLNSSISSTLMGHDTQGSPYQSTPSPLTAQPVGNSEEQQQRLNMNLIMAQEESLQIQSPIGLTALNQLPGNFNPPSAIETMSPMLHHQSTQQSSPAAVMTLENMPLPQETMMPLQLPPASTRLTPANRNHSTSTFPSPPKTTPQQPNFVNSRQPMLPHTPPLAPTPQVNLLRASGAPMTPGSLSIQSSPGLRPVQSSPLIHPIQTSISNQDLKRERHKISEKNRRLVAKSGYDTLIDLLPQQRKEQWSTTGKVPSRNAILQVTTDYIRELQHKERELEKELQRLRDEKRYPPQNE